jgi:hypothetical protein
MKKTIATTAIAFAALLAYATITGEYNTWLGYLAGDGATGDRVTVQGAGAGGGAQDLYRTDFIGAAAGVYSYRIFDTVGIGYRALRYSSDVSNTVAIGSHALEGVNMGGITDATWINGHFVVNPPVYNGSWWQQTPGEFYITGDASKTNSLAPIWYDGTNLHLRGYSPGGNADRAETYGTATRWTDAYGNVWSVSNTWAASSESVQFGSWNIANSEFDLWKIYFLVNGVPAEGYANNPATLTSWTLTSNEWNYVDSWGNSSVSNGNFEVTFSRQAITNSPAEIVGRVAMTNDVVLANALAGQTFDLSTNEGLVEAVSNIVMVLGGRISPGN